MDVSTYYFGQFYPENCIKLKKMDRTGLRVPSASLESVNEI